MEGQKYDVEEYIKLYKEQFQAQLEAPMPWIGMYVAAASLACSIAMAGDVIHGIRRKKLWFPCKYFSMNAASLTAIAVAVKLSVDLTTTMWGMIDVLAKLSSGSFMVTVMGNFLISFASMKNKEIFMNITALGILVLTTTVNMIIQLYTCRRPGAPVGAPLIRISNLLNIVSMFVLLVTMISSALSIPAAKMYLELKYNKWVMAETGSLQFVMARSVISAISGVICLATAISFVALAITEINYYGLMNFDSTYRWSTVWIVMIQSIGVVVGTIAPISRWFMSVNFNCNNNIFTSHHNNKEFKLVETFWIQGLVEWKETPLPSQIRGMKCKRVIGNVKILVLNLCIGVQIGIVLASKLVHSISIVIKLSLSSCFCYGERMKERPESESGDLQAKYSSPELDLYVMRLEGEAKLPRSILKSMCHELSQVIQKGKSQQPQNLLELLRKSENSFKGVLDFDSNLQVQYCWALPVITLTSIAVALP